MDDNHVLGLMERWWASRYQERHALVTSYDPKNYLAKVMFMPEGYESGWLPIETGHIGAGYGVAIGLQPGDGKSSGDQVVVRLQEGDFESGKIVQRVHSDNDKPPQVQSGEMVFWSKFQKSGGGADSAQGGQGGTGQQIYFKNDGSITVTDGNGATIVFDGGGNIKITANLLQIDAQTITAIASGDLGIKAGGNLEAQGGSFLGLDAAKVTVQGGGSVSDGSVSPPKQQPTIPSFTVPG